MAEAPTLEIRDLVCIPGSRTARSRPREEEVLRGVSLTIGRNETYGLLGRSGVGKTTLMKCICGLEVPLSGSITLRGRSVFPRADAQGRPMVQMVFQASGASLDPTMSVADSIAESVWALGRDGSRAVDVVQLLASVGLSSELLHRRPGELSGGQRQRVAIARALAARPELLLLDEPTSALDTLTQAQVLDLLSRLHAGFSFSVMLITHDVHAALSYCDRVGILHDGRIVEEGTPRELIRSASHPHTRILLNAAGVPG